MARVLLITDIFPPQIGGPATFIDRLAGSLAARDHHVTVVCSSHQPREASDAARRFRVRRVNLVSREQYEIRIRLRLAFEMARHRLIFVNGLERYVAEVNHGLRRPYVLKIVGDKVWENARNHGLTRLSIDEFQEDPGSQRQFALDIQRRNRWVTGARHIVVPSEYLRRLVEGWGVSSDRITVIRNGTTLTSMTEPRVRTAPRLRALFVGRLTNWKGVETLLLAAREVPHIDVDIVGDGPEWPHLTELASQLGLDARVKFRGRLPAEEVRSAMANADVLVLTSLYEGLSHTILEGFAAGLPCIVSSRGGNEETVAHEVNGIVVPAQDVSALADGLRRLANCEHDRFRLATAAFAAARMFDLSETITRTERLLLDACGPAAGPSLAGRAVPHRLASPFSPAPAGSERGAD